MLFLYPIATGLLGVIFVWVSALNWHVFWRGYVRKETDVPSWIPLLGGLAGAAALLVAPIPQTRSFFWLPLLLDWGSAPGIGYSLWWIARKRVHQQK